MDTLQDRVVDEFIRIVKIDSLSLKEDKMFDYLKQRFVKLPVELKWNPYTVESTGSQSGNLIVKLGANSGEPKKKLFFDAHVDTVEPGIGIQPLVDGDRIRSDGSTILGSDDKSGVAAMIVAIEEIVSRKIQHNDIYFVFTSAEEIGLMGVTYLDFKEIPADFGYILDSHGSVGAIITAAPYHYHYKITVKGRASHAGIEPEKGISAIKAAALIVTELPQGRINENSVSNVGMIEGGKANNIVPDECVIEGEYRSLVESDIDMLNSLVTRAALKYNSQAVEIKIEQREMYKGFDCKPEEPIAQLIAKALKAIGIEPRYEKTGGGSNTNIYNQNGIPALTLASGMQEVHSTQEYILIEDLVKLTELVVKTVELA